MSEILEIAHFWLMTGWKVLPIQPGSKMLLKGFGPSLRALGSMGEVQEVFNGKNLNLAVLAPQGAIVLDFDDFRVYQDWQRKNRELAKAALTEITPGGGFHVFLRSKSQNTHLKHFRPIKGLEIKRAVLVYPSKLGFKSYKREKVGYVVDCDLKEVLKGFGEFSINREGLAKKLISEEKTVKRLKYPNMALNPVERVKELWPILFYLAIYEKDLKLIGSGRWLRGLCPFHDDHNPSLWVDVERNLFGCFSCGVKGDVINFHAKKFGLSIKAALADLLAQEPDLAARPPQMTFNPFPSGEVQGPSLRSAALAIASHEGLSLGGGVVKGPQKENAVFGGEGGGDAKPV